MRSFLDSLQFRLMIGFAVVLVLALGSVSVYGRYAAAHEIERFANEITAIQEERLETIVQRFLDNGIRGPRLEQFIEQAGSLYGLRIAVTDETGQIISETSQAPDYAFFGERFQRPKGTLSLILAKSRLGRHEVARTERRAAILPLGQGDIDLSAVAFTDAGPGALVRVDPSAERLVAATSRHLMWTGIGAGIIAIVISMFVSRRTLSPLRSLQYAAERLGAGDLSQRVTVTRNDEVSDMARKFNAMADELEQAEAQRRILMADVAHELRTPLANIQGYVEAIRDGVVDPDESTIDTLHQQVLHLAHLIEDLRLLALVEAGALPLDAQPVSLVKLALMSMETFRFRADAKKISLSYVGPDTIPTVALDKERITQVMGNLLENAIQHTPHQGAIVVSVRVTSTSVVVGITDTGPGIPPNEIKRIFDRFHRLDPSRSRATGGSGLGLTITKQLVEAHGGTITVSSNENEGSTFTFEFPLNG